MIELSRKMLEAMKLAMDEFIDGEGHSSPCPHPQELRENCLRSRAWIEQELRRPRLEDVNAALEPAELTDEEAAGLERRRGASAEERTGVPLPHLATPWPIHWPKYYNGRDPCDMLIGPCSCGATHSAGEFSLRDDGMIQRKL